MSTHHHNKFEFCSSCGNTLKINKNNSSISFICNSCNKEFFLDPKIAVATVLENNNKILFVKRAIEPGIGLWSLPGGYVNQGERVENAAAREVFEEIGAHVRIESFLGVFSETNNPVIVIGYLGKFITKTIWAKSEISAIKFFKPFKLPPLAFQRDRIILASWLKLKNK